MSKLHWNVLKAAPLVVGASLLVANGAIAQNVDNLDNFESNQDVLNQVDLYNYGEPEVDQEDPMAQVTNISQLRDVSPGDWAFEALRNLVEKYGCIAGYPDGTFRGNRALTRYEFAAGLNACLQQIERLIGGDDGDLETLRRLLQEFEAELAALGARVDNLEGRVAFLEDHQFSTTTKLTGEVIFTAAGQFSDQLNDLEADHIILADRVRLNLDSSFTGTDTLHLQLEAGNFGQFTEVSQMARLGHDYDSDNDLRLNEVWYNKAFNDNKIKLWAGTAGLNMDKFLKTYNPYMASSGTGGLSRFLRFNPAVYRTDVDGQALVTNFKFGDNFGADIFYTASQGNDPDADRGLFNGPFGTGVQLNWNPTDNLGLGFTYVHSYHDGSDLDLSGNTGSQITDDPFPGSVGSEANRFGLQGSWKINDTFNFAAWGGYVDASARGANGDAEIWNWAAILSVVDVGKEGAVINLGGGMLPKVTNADGVGVEDNDTSYMIEANYKYPITDNILITPGFYVIFAPEHNNGNDNDTIWVGAVRTTFKF